MALPNTHLGYEGIRSVMGEGKKSIFFAGVGGISMNSLAQVCALRGHRVSGYDRTKTDITCRLESLGVTVYYESSPEIVENVDILVYTVAMPDDDPAYVRAGELGIPRISRADFLGYIMMGYTSRVGVSGMHGKSTTTALTASVYSAAGADPTVFGGAVMKDCGSSNLIGGDCAFIFEACEYMDSFLDFYPTTAIVLNIEMDHVDYFRSMEQIKTSFTAFMNRAKTAVVNIADSDVMEAARRSGAEIVTFGEGRRDADYYAENVTFSKGYASFDIFCRGSLLCRAEMRVPGRHMVTDALAAAAAAHRDGITPEAIEAGLKNYTGIKRRMELRGQTVEGISVFDDYAHHPTELRSTLSAAAELGYGRTLCVFQPHTFSRTAELLDDFAAALGGAAVDEVVLAEIYPAREKNIYGVSSALLAEKIRERGRTCRVLPDFDSIAAYVKASLSDGDAAFIIGAGDINKVSGLLVE